MPESRGRSGAPFTPPPPKAAPSAPNPRWWAPLMVALLVVGLLYIVVAYLSGFTWPVGVIGRWNIVVGFVIMMSGFGMLTKWR